MRALCHRLQLRPQAAARREAARHRLQLPAQRIPIQNPSATTSTASRHAAAELVLVLLQILVALVMMQVKVMVVVVVLLLLVWGRQRLDEGMPRLWACLRTLPEARGKWVLRQSVRQRTLFAQGGACVCMCVCVHV